MTKVVVPISGGMDSTVLLHSAVRKFDSVEAISFNYNQRHLKELKCAATTCKVLYVPHKVVDISFFSHLVNTSALTNRDISVANARDVMGDPQTLNYVPNRNMMLLSIAAAYAESVGADVVYHGAAQADSVAGFWDGSTEFVTKLNEVLFLNRRNKIRIEAPLINLSKAEIIQLGVQYGVNFKETWTCYVGDDEACGECTACSLRLKGFIDAGIPDPIIYKKKIDWKHLIS